MTISANISANARLARAERAVKQREERLQRARLAHLCLPSRSKPRARADSRRGRDDRHSLASAGEELHQRRRALRG